MTKILIFVLCLLAFGTTFAQEEELSKEEKERREKNIQAGNPFAEFGYKAKVATLSKGKYLEVHDLDSIVKIGSSYWHVRKQKIVGNVIQDSTDIYRQPLFDTAGRWLSPDPLAEEFPEWSPYNFVENSPIVLTDPTGLYAEHFATRVVNEDNPDQVIDIDDGYDFIFYVNQEEFDEIASNDNNIEGTSVHNRWFWETVAFEMRKSNSDSFIDSFLQWFIYDGVADAIDNTANERYATAGLAMVLSKLKFGEDGYKLVKKLSKYGKKVKYQHLN